MFTIEDEDDVMAVLTDQRDLIVRELTKHCGDGRLTLDELETRIEEAYAAASLDELRAVLRDLPTDETVLRAAGVADAPQVRAERRPFEAPKLPPLPDLPKLREPEWHKPVGAACTIGGFILLFNGMFWLALLVWFVLPGIVMQKKACH